MRIPADIVVVGGGVIGLTAAFVLARRGMRVAVLDAADQHRPASWAGAGIIPPGTDRSEWLRGFSSRAFAEWSAELSAITGIDPGYRRCGGVEFGVDPRTVSAWREEAIAFTPFADGAYYLPDYAQVRNPRFLRALRSALLAGGRAEFDGPFREWTIDGDRVTAARTDAAVWRADRFVVAAGVWSPQILAGLGWSPDSVPVRGQLVALRTDPALVPHILLSGKRYVVPRFDGLVLVGSTEEDAGFDAVPTADGVRQLVTFAHSLIPELADAEVEAAWAGLRPGNRDGRPTIGPVPGWRNLFVATGHFRGGIQQSPGTAELLAALVRNEPPPTDPAPFAADRPIGDPVASPFKS